MVGECKRSCCWTPFGHSAAAKDCHCHDDPDPGVQLLRDIFGGDAA